MYVGSYGNGALKRVSDKSEAVKFGVKKYVSDGSYVLYEKNDKEYLSQYLNIKHVVFVNTFLKIFSFGCENFTIDFLKVW